MHALVLIQQIKINYTVYLSKIPENYLFLILLNFFAVCSFCIQVLFSQNVSFVLFTFPNSDSLKQQRNLTQHQ